MVKRKRAALVKLQNLPMLQNLIRRDPPSYQEEFLLQYRHYESQRDIFMSAPSSSSNDSSGADKFAELVGFMAQVANCYPQHTKTFPEELSRLLLNNHATLHTDLREKLVQSLVLLRNKDVITSADLLKVLFPILTVTKSKVLRSQIYTTVISEMRNANAKAKNHRLNKTVQTVLFNLVEIGKEDPLSTTGLWAVKLTRELWKRGIWDDARTVEIMKEAALSRNQKVMVGGARFFLGVDQEKEEMMEGGDSDDEDVKGLVENLRKGAGISKTNKKKRQLEKAVATMKKKERQKHKPHSLNFSALHLLRDPQGFAEQLYSLHLSKQNKLNLENKLIVLNLITRLVGLHKLELLPIYSYMLKYLTPRQRDVTQVLACAAQASHDLVPPDALEPILKKIADEFVSEGVASEIATVGLNAIREICVRAPLAMNITLLQDLTEYKGSSDRGVMMAARSLIGLYREVAPEMLKKKDRGKMAAMGMKEAGSSGLRFGEEKAGVIEGLELLEEWKEQQRRLKAGEAAEGEDGESENDEDEDEAAWDGWDVEEEDDSDNEGWINVESDKEIEISDSEDEKPVKKPKIAKGKKKSEEDEADDDEKEVVAEQKSDEQKANEAEMKREEKRINNLAITRILTPADFAKLAELRMQAGVDKLTGKKPEATPHRTNEDAVDTDVIARTYKSIKATKEERLAKVMEGREDRDKFGSSKHKKLAEKPHSTTNREKARKKNFLMTLSSAKRKQRRSLTDKAKVLKAHKEKQKKKGH